MTAARPRAAAALLALAVLLAACAAGPSITPGRPTVVVTYSVLGAVVRELVGDAANVVVLMPNGADPHDWSPSAKDIEAATKADLLVENGLGLEGGLATTFALSEEAGVPRFVAADHVTVRHVGAGQGVSATDVDQAAGAPDPHLWMDPLAMREVVAALAPVLRADLGIDVAGRAAAVEADLDALNVRVAGIVATIPPSHRTLVTGHESLGYFAQRYGLTLVGAIIPSLSPSSAPTAADLSALAAQIRALGVPVIFTEVGTSSAVADALGSDTGARVVEVTTHALPPDGRYATFLANIATAIAENLR